MDKLYKLTVNERGPQILKIIHILLVTMEPGLGTEIQHMFYIVHLIQVTCITNIRVKFTILF